MVRRQIMSWWRAAAALAMAHLSTMRAAGLRPTVKLSLIAIAVCWMILSMIGIMLRRPACTGNGFEDYGVRAPLWNH